MPALHALAPGTLLPDIQRQSSEQARDDGPDELSQRRGRGRRRMRATRSHRDTSDGGKAEEEEEVAAGDRTTPGVRPPVEAYSYAAHLLNGMGQLKDALGRGQSAAGDGRSNGQGVWACVWLCVAVVTAWHACVHASRSCGCVVVVVCVASPATSGRGDECHTSR